ncbi:hypothetical protein M1349_02150 [Patescibacteria group bacterium]|nr:hypothetical protein [Patescibacteria group bacterium]
MGAEDSRFLGIITSIENLKKSERPIGKFLARSLEELYLSENYRTAILNATDEKRRPKALRLIAIHEGRLASYVLMANIDKKEGRRILDKMVEQTQRIPKEVDRLGAFSNLALKALKEANLQTVAGMQVSESAATGRNIYETFYPKPFMSFLAETPIEDYMRGILSTSIEEYRSDLGLGIASYFLRNIRFGSGVVNFEF